MCDLLTVGSPWTGPAVRSVVPAVYGWPTVRVPVPAECGGWPEHEEETSAPAESSPQDALTHWLRWRAKAAVSRLTDAADREVARCALAVVCRLRHAGWRPVCGCYRAADRGAVGKHVERLLADRLSRRRRWQCDLLVDNASRRIIAVGQHAGIPAGSTQVDVIRLRRDARRFEVGQRFDAERVSHLYEVKSSARGHVAAEQVERLAALIGGRPVRRLHAAVARFSYGEQRWEANPAFREAVVEIGAQASSGPVEALPPAPSRWPILVPGRGWAVPTIGPAVRVRAGEPPGEWVRVGDIWCRGVVPSPPG